MTDRRDPVIGIRCAAINSAARLLQSAGPMSDDDRVRRAVAIADRLEAWLSTGIKPPPAALRDPR